MSADKRPLTYYPTQAYAGATNNSLTAAGFAVSIADASAYAVIMILMVMKDFLEYNTVK